MQSKPKETAMTSGASDRAIMDHWFAVPDGLDLTQAAALPMALDTAYLHLTALGLTPGRTILINGAGGTIGYAAVQIALIRGLRVIATAGPTYAKRLRELGDTVTSYGDGVVQRVKAVSDGPVDLVLDTAPVGGALPGLVEIAGGDPRRVLTISDVEAAQQLGVRDTFHEAPDLLSYRFEAFPEFARRAADGTFTVPIAGVFPLADWRAAMELSLTGRARGKLLLRP
jgi:NADPH:quinone reductase-like Zn-dependent oxidoreductase